MACGGCGFHFYGRLVDSSYDDSTDFLGSGCITLGSNNALASVAGIRARHSERLACQGQRLCHRWMKALVLAGSMGSCWARDRNLLYKLH